MGNNNTLPSATRRLFLQRTLLALGAVAAAPALSTQALANTASTAIATPKLDILTAEDYRILSAVTDTLIPRGGAFPLGALDIDLAARIDTYLDPEDAELMQGLRGALMFLEHKAPDLVGQQGNFSTQSAADRETLLLRLRDAGGDATAVFVALRSLCFFYFYTDEQAWPNIGYEGPLVERGRPVYPQVRG